MLQFAYFLVQTSASTTHSFLCADVFTTTFQKNEIPKLTPTMLENIARQSQIQQNTFYVPVIFSRLLSPYTESSLPTPTPLTLHRLLSPYTDSSLPTPTPLSLHRLLSPYTDSSHPTPTPLPLHRLLSPYTDSSHPTPAPLTLQRLIPARFWLLLMHRLVHIHCL